MMGELKTKRVYRPAEEPDGYRVLVDRLWPRGLAKAGAGIDEWNKEIAPTPALRSWFGHKPENFPLFSGRYAAELDGNPAAYGFAERCREMLRSSNVTLLYGAKDERCNHAAVLRDWLLEYMYKPGAG